MEKDKKNLKAIILLKGSKANEVYDFISQQDLDLLLVDEELIVLNDSEIFNPNYITTNKVFVKSNYSGNFEGIVQIETENKNKQPPYKKTTEKYKLKDKF